MADGESPPTAEMTGEGDDQRSALVGASPHMDENAQQSVPVVENSPHIDVSTQQSSAESDIVMSDGWKLRPASVPGGRLVSWNVGLSGFWNVRSAISRLRKESHPSVILLQDLKVSLTARKSVIRTCHRIAPQYTAYFTGGCDPQHSGSSYQYSLLTPNHKTLQPRPHRELASKLGFTLGTCPWMIGSSRLPSPRDKNVENCLSSIYIKELKEIERRFYNIFSISAPMPLNAKLLFC